MLNGDMGRAEDWLQSWLALLNSFTRRFPLPATAPKLAQRKGWHAG